MRNITQLPRGFRTDGVAGRVKDSNVYIGVVKKNDDVQRMGRIAVWIPEMGGDPNVEKNWLIVRYASPFAGVTSPEALVKDGTGMADTQRAYGFWMQPPDLENHVLVCFVNGDTAQGFYFACVWQQNMNYSVPGLASGNPADGSGQRAGNYPPVVEYNKRSNENPDAPHRPVFTPLDEGLSNQGLYPDLERGVTSASARREAPSEVFGYSTPRGQQIYADDNPNNEFIRFRTRSGAQVLIHETTGFVYINSKEGNSWAEISDKGIDLYSAGTISMRAEGSLNIHADASLNIEADGNLNLRAGGNLTFQSANHTNFAGNGNFIIDMGGTSSIKSAGNILLDSGGALRLGAGGDISSASGGANIRSASAILDNAGSAPSPSAPSATVATPITLPDVNGSGPAYSTITRQTILRRLPTHEPFAGHPNSADAGLGVNGANEFASANDRQNTLNSPNPNLVIDPAALQNVSDDDLTWMTVCMCTEANGLGNDMLAAVAQVILNRVAINYPVKENSWTGVKHQVLGHFQFSRFNASTNEQTELIGKSLIKQYQSTASWNNVMAIAKQVSTGSYTGAAVAPIKANKRCVQYLNLAIVGPSPPNGWGKWAIPSKFVTEVGRRPSSHSFYLL